MEEVSANCKHATCIVTASKLCTFDLLGAHLVCVSHHLVLSHWIGVATTVHIAIRNWSMVKKFSNIFFIYYFQQDHLLMNISSCFFRCIFFVAVVVGQINFLAAKRRQRSNELITEIHVKLLNHQQKSQFHSAKHLTKQNHRDPMLPFACIRENHKFSHRDCAEC